MAKGKSGGLLSKPNLIKMAVGVVATLFVLGKVNQASDQTSLTYKFGKAVGLKT